MTADLKAFWTDHFDKVEGFVDQRLLPYLELVRDIQQRPNVTGNVAEIGVFNGKFLIPMAHLAAPEKCVAIDVFED